MNFNLFISQVFSLFLFQSDIQYEVLISELDWIRNTKRPMIPELVPVKVTVWTPSSKRKTGHELVFYRGFMDELADKIN